MVRIKSHTHRHADGSQELAGIFHAQLFDLLSQEIRPTQSAG
jgi:hypothetical protein